MTCTPFSSILSFRHAGTLRARVLAALTIEPRLAADIARDLPSGCDIQRVQPMLHRLASSGCATEEYRGSGLRRRAYYAVRIGAARPGSVYLYRIASADDEMKIGAEIEEPRYRGRRYSGGHFLAVFVCKRAIAA